MQGSATVVNSVMASLVAADDVSRYCPLLRGKIHICLDTLFDRYMSP